MSGKLGRIPSPPRAWFPSAFDSDPECDEGGPEIDGWEEEQEKMWQDELRAIRQQAERRRWGARPSPITPREERAYMDRKDRVHKARLERRKAEIAAQSS